MSTLEKSLELLEYKSLEDVTIENLKKSFRSLAREEHPDRGGDGNGFDQLLSAFVFLSGVLRRQTGGRDKAGVLHPENVQQAREEQYLSELGLTVDEVLNSVQYEKERDFIKTFNERYEEYKQEEAVEGFSSSEERCYKDWFASDEKSCVSFLPDGEYGPFTMAPPIMKQEDLHLLFEQSARCGKKIPVTDLTLLPHEMAVPSSSSGMTLVPSSTEPFTSQLQEKPRYVDLQDAFTTHTTIVDKLPLYEESTRTFEDLLQERDIVYQSEHDRDLEAISLYERAYQQQEQEHKKRIESFFASTGASSWALSSGSA